MQGFVLNLFENHFDRTADRVVCKFVLMRLAEQFHLVFGPQPEYPYHASLVEIFCRRNRISSGWEHKPDLYEICEGDCEILGGGYLDISPVHRKVAVFGSSTAYGAFPVPEFRLIAASEGFFEGYAVTVQ